jgi:hypothetical protein
MPEITDAEWERVLGWAGFRHPTQDECPLARDVSEWFLYPDGDIRAYLPSIDLNNIFKWVVPKLQEKAYMIDLLAYECSGYKASIWTLDDIDPIVTKESEDPVTALVKAILEVIRNERD